MEWNIMDLVYSANGTGDIIDLVYNANGTGDIMDLVHNATRTDTHWSLPLSKILF